MTRSLSIQFSLLLALGCVSASPESLAFEPPRTSLRDALPEASSGFIGRIVSIKEVARRPFETDAVGEIKISRCLCGDGCGVDQVVQLRFRSQTTREREFPVSFPISHEVIVLFARSGVITESMQFSSSWAQPPDLGYLLESYPDKYPADTPTREVRSVYTFDPAGTVDLSAPLTCGGKAVDH